MNKEDFKEAVRGKLRNVPLETRRLWSSTDLLEWWKQAKANDSYLSWEKCPGGDVWQWVRGMCSDLIGKDATW